MNYKDFEIIGLNETESKIYLAIISLGEAVVSEIANKSGVKRTTAYLSLHTLKSKGLIGQAKKNGSMRYFAEDPRVLEKIMKKNNDRFTTLMPEISSIIKLIHHKPSVQYFEGKNCFKKVYHDILVYKKQEVASWLPCTSNAVIDKYFSSHFNPERLANKISLKAIISGTLQSAKPYLSNHKINKIKFSPKEISFGNSEIHIYSKNKIGIISIDEDLSIIIESKKIHDTLKGIFDLLWLKL